MRYVNYLVALMALCILAIPAFSMRDNGNIAGSNDQTPAMAPMGEDSKQMPCDCPCDNSRIMGPDGKKASCHKHAGEPMMGQMGQDGNQGCGEQKAMMGQTEQDPMEQDMMRWCDEQKAAIGQGEPSLMEQDVMRWCDEQKAIIGQGEQSQMEQDGSQGCGCMKSMMGQMEQDGNQGCGCMKSMMGQMKQDGNQNGHKHIKSMMGGKELGHGVVKVVIINVNV